MEHTTPDPTPESARQVVVAAGAPAAIGPYSHAVRATDLLFCSGQLPLDPATGDLVDGGAASQAEQCLRNLEAVCTAAGTTLARATRVGVYLTDLATLDDINAIFARIFTSAPPARTALEVAALPRGAQIEIEAIVAL